MPKDLELAEKLEELWRDTTIRDDQFFIVVAKYVQGLLIDREIKIYEFWLMDEMDDGSHQRQRIAELKAEKQSFELK